MTKRNFPHTNVASVSRTYPTLRALLKSGRGRGAGKTRIPFYAGYPGRGGPGTWAQQLRRK
jgi:hypothetical protein